MPLSESEIADIQADVDKANDRIMSAVTTITNSTHASVLGLQSATDAIQTAKQLIQDRTEFLKSRVTGLEASIDEIVSNTHNIQNTIDMKIKYENDTKKKETDAKILYDLRADQTNALKEKNKGNYHSSFLGLWKPLTEESQIGLLILSVVFGLLSFVSILFLMSGNFPNMIPASLRSQSPSIAKLTGGFLEFSKKKNK